MGIETHASLAIGLLIVTTACAPTSVPVSGARPVEKYVAPSRMTIRSSTEAAHSPRTGYTIYVENSSTVTILVTSVILRNCENVRGICNAPVPMNVRIKPGQREVIRRIDRRNEGMSMSYRYSWTWRPEGETVAVATIDDAPPPTMPGQPTPGSATAALARATDPFLTGPDIAAMRHNIGAIRAEPDSIEMRVGESRDLTQFSVALYDTLGVRRGRIPFGFRFPSSMVSFVPPNFTALAPGRAVAEFYLPGGLSAAMARPPKPAELVIIIRP